MNADRYSLDVPAMHCAIGECVVTCSSCGAPTVKSTADVRRARHRNAKMYCGPVCLAKGRGEARGSSHPSFVNLAGKRFGRLVVVDLAEARGGKIAWRCVCDCGNEHVTRAGNLRSGSTSCGCLQRERAMAVGDRSRTHGMKGTTTYTIWMGMIQRCHNPNASDYQRYGARGILVCERWRTFENFLADMGLRPPQRSIDRIDNDKGYEPGNCRWATASEQVRNSRAALQITIGERTQCLSAWLLELGLSLNTYSGRRQRGWAIERSLTTPPDKRFSHRRPRHA